MRRTLAAAVLGLAAAATVPGVARADAGSDTFVDRAVVWCLSGATVSGGLTALVAAPALQSGVATQTAASAVVASATVGCGVGVAWAVALTGYTWAWDKVRPTGN